MTRVLVGQSYFLRFDPKLWEAQQPYPPLGALYACACLRARGHEVVLFDAMLAPSEDDWDRALDRTRPRIAVLFEDNFNYLSKMCLLRMRQAALAMIARARARGCVIIVAGSDASDHPESYLDAGADYVIVGEGERTLEALVDAIARVRSSAGGQTQDADDARPDLRVDAIAGLAFRIPSGDIRRTGPRPDIADLDGLPPPAWDLVDVEKYQRTWRAAHGRFSLNLVTTRGCPYHCNWCAKPIWGQRYNVHTPERVASDLASLHDRGADHVWFADDILGLKPGWLSHFADVLEERRLRLPFKCQTRADLLLRPGDVDALRRAGAEMVWIGAESGSQRILDAMEKGTAVGDIEEASRRLRAAGIGVGFFLQFGYPGETRDDIDATFDLVRRCRPDDIGMSVAYPLPGTPFFTRVRHEIGLVDHWVDSNDLAMLYRGPYSTSFYRQLHTVLHREFRARRALESLKRRTTGDFIGPRPHDGSWCPASAGPSALHRVATLVWNGARLPLARLRLEQIARRDTRDDARRPQPSLRADIQTPRRSEQGART
jgi:radical SAM superfamily enzyme YgiQ (UPF0313 family)